MRGNGWLWVGGGILAVLFLGSRTNTGKYYMTELANSLGHLTDEQKANLAKYSPLIAAAEKTNGLPADLLGRLLFTESSFLTSIITGARPSPVGALGIGQFMPATAKEMGINPRDPAQSIAAAAKYLASLKKQSGTWTKAVAAYNWGIGNVLKKGLDAAPQETRDYVKKILGVTI